MSLYEVILNASRILGPSLGGILLATSGTTACFAANAVSFVAPLVVLLRYPSQQAVHPLASSRADRKGATRAGFAYVKANRVLLACIALAVATGVLFNSSILFPLLATRAFGMGGGGYGALLASFGVGALPGAFLAARAGTPTGQRVRLLAGATGLSMAATAYAPEVGVAFVSMAVTGFVSIWLIASANTLVQLLAAPDMRGRVMGLWTMALPGTIPITGIAVALLADAHGPRCAFAIGGACIALTGAAGWSALGAADGGSR